MRRSLFLVSELNEKEKIMRKLFAVLLVGCAMSLGCGEQPKAIPPEQTQALQPVNDPASSVGATETGESAGTEAAGESGEVVTGGEASGVLPADAGTAAPSGETAAPAAGGAAAPGN